MSAATIGHLAAFATNLLFGLNTNITKSLFSASWISPLGFALTRVLFCFAAFWIIGLFFPKEKIIRKDIPVIVIAGLIGLLVAPIVFAFGIWLISPITVSIIIALNPIIVLLLSTIFLKDKITLKKTIGVITGISGAALVILQNNSSSLSPNSKLGILVVLAGVFCNAGYFIIVRKIRDKYSSITLMKWMFLLPAIIVIPVAMTVLPHQKLYSPEISLIPMIQLCFALVFCSLIGYILVPVSLKRIKATTNIMYVNIQPLAAAIVAIIAGQDSFSWDKPIALVLILAGVFIVSRNNPEEAENAKSTNKKTETESY